MAKRIKPVESHIFSSMADAVANQAQAAAVYSGEELTKDVGFNAVRNALIETGAKLIGRGEGPNGSVLSWHTLNGNVVIFQAYANNEGCEVYRSVYDGLSVEETIKAMRKYLAGPAPAVTIKEPEFTILPSYQRYSATH